jgi:hypothetical protein
MGRLHNPGAVDAHAEEAVLDRGDAEALEFGCSQLGLSSRVFDESGQFMPGRPT